MSTSRIVVRVPASTANLGPGFDALGMALALHDEVEVTVIPSGLQVEVQGEGVGQVPTDERNLVVRALLAACARLRLRPEGLRLRCRNSIPHARGLGSSAAAAVAGVLAGYGLAGRQPDQAALGWRSQQGGPPHQRATNDMGSRYGRSHR